MRVKLYKNNYFYITFLNYKPQWTSDIYFLLEIEEICR